MLASIMWMCVVQVALCYFYIEFCVPDMCKKVQRSVQSSECCHCSVMSAISLLLADCYLMHMLNYLAIIVLAVIIPKGKVIQGSLHPRGVNIP